MGFFKNDVNIAILDFGHIKKRWSESGITIGRGIKEIVRELNLYEIIFIKPNQIYMYDWVLITFTSHYDVISFAYIIPEIIKGNCKLVAGGAGLNNPELFDDIIDYQLVGRGEDVITNLIYNDDDSEFFKKGRAIKIVQPKRLLKIGDWQEKSVGCSIGCKFCQYGHKFKNKKNTYQSGYNAKEDFLTAYKWKNRNGITALDGFTEETRFAVGKKMTDERVIEKIKEIYKLPEKTHKLKMYNIVGFPDETVEDMEKFKSVLKKADKISYTMLTIWILSTHFVPMRFTPMENEKVSMVNFRNYIFQNMYVHSFFKGSSINVKFMPHITTPNTALENWATQHIHNLDEFLYFLKKNKSMVEKNI